MAKINGGIATILIGGYTPSEVEERIARYDDAVSAVKSAKEGVVAGGGVALASACFVLEGLDNVTVKSILAPMNKILSNANAVYSFVEYPKGYDVKEYKEVNMFEVGIVDTLKGIKTALINASSASNNLLRCNYVMPYKRTQNGN